MLDALNEKISTHNSHPLQSQLPVDRSMWWQQRLMVDSVVLTEITDVVGTASAMTNVPY